MSKKSSQRVTAEPADQVKPGNLAIKDKSPTGSATQQKTIWSCSLCQQRQQILAKTGKWFYSGDKDRASSEEPPLLPADSSAATAGLDRPVTPVQKGQEGGPKSDQRQQDAKKDGIKDQVRLQEEEKRTAASPVVISEPKVPSPGDARQDLSASPTSSDRSTSKGTNALQRRQSLQDRRYAMINEQSDRSTPIDQVREQRRDSGAKLATRKTSKEKRGSIAPDTVSLVSQNATVHQKAHIGKVKSEPTKQPTAPLQPTAVARAKSEDSDRPVQQQRVAVQTQALEKTHTDDRSPSRLESVHQKAPRLQEPSEEIATRETEKAQQRQMHTITEPQAKDDRLPKPYEQAEYHTGQPSTAQTVSSSRRQSQQLLAPKESTQSFKQTSSTKQHKIMKQQEVSLYEADAKELEVTQRRRHRSPSAAGSSESGVDQLQYPALARGRPEKYREDRSDQIRSPKEMPGEYRAAETSKLPFTTDRVQQPSSHYGQATRRRSRPLIVNSAKEGSLSSSEEDLPSTSECQSYDDMESESFSDRGKHLR
ncbi:hypothetical protein D918_06201 [Trichuris suis]|nr:hypothetical protein D918_06201 [Trichuris suis]